MNEENNASETSSRQGVSPWIIIVIILLLLLGASAIKFSGPLSSIDGADIANVTLWSTSEKASSSEAFKTAKSNPDLSIKIVSVGVLDDDGKFTETTTIETTLTGAVRVLVQNTSKKLSEPWSLQIKLPTNNSYTYTSSSFDALTPKESKSFLIAYDKVEKLGQHELEISLQISDGNDENNTDTRTIQVVQ